MNGGETYNPLDRHNLGRSVAAALLNRPVAPLGQLKAFDGAGIYAIYYAGAFSAYKSIAVANSREFTRSIYVGKAVPPGARKGGFGLDANPGKVLFKRFKEHAESIISSTNLRIDDFHCRYLITDDIWIPLAEAMLIDLLNPIWNRVLDGFGNHDPGKGRYQQQRSAWDTVHPGRPWAGRLRPGQDIKELLRRVADFLKGKPVPTIATEDAVVDEE